MMIGQLVENAVTFTKEGGHVRLRAERGMGVVRFTVSDNGPGVAADDLKRIQEPFEQVGRGTSDHTKGAGLGLATARTRGLAELQDGTFEIASAPGQGFTAIVELPGV